MKIGHRTIKTAIGTPIAIALAQFFGITNFITAGILTLLSIQPSRQRSLNSARDRLFACLIGIVFSYVLFELLGYHTIVVGLLLLLFIPVTVSLKITEGIVTSCVIILYLFSTGNITTELILSQLLLIFIGIGVALILNLYMPSLDHLLKKQQEALEANFQKILAEIALYIKDKERLWDGAELIETEEILAKSLKLVWVDKENNIWRSNHTYFDYFVMRNQQYELLKNMLPLVSELENVESISDDIAQFFDHLSQAVHPGNTAILFIEELDVVWEKVRAEELPATREEFETRANLFRLLHEIEAYLKIKKRFKSSDVPLKKKKRLKK